MTVLSGISSGNMVFKLSLDVAEQSAGAKAKHFCAHPRLAEFFFDEGQPIGGLLGGANAAGRLEANGHARLLCVLSDSAKHNQTHGKSGICRFFAGRGLDKIRARHHGDKTGASDIAEGQQIAGAENHLYVGGAASLAEGGYFVVESLPPSAENMSAGDDDINFVGARLEGAANFGNTLGQRRQSRGKSSRNRGDANAAAFESVHSGFDKGVIDASGGHLDVEFLDAQFL